MLYGFESRGTLYVAAAETQEDFARVEDILEDAGLEYEYASLEALTVDQRLADLPEPPVIIVAGDVDENLLTIVSIDEAVARAISMHSKPSEDIDDSLYALFKQSEEAADIVEEHEILLLDWGDIGLTSDSKKDDWVFCVINDGFSTLVIMVPVPFYEDHGNLIAENFEMEYRVGHLLDLPDRLVEIKPGNFICEDTPLGAVEEMKSFGYTESPELFHMLIEKFHADPTASTKLETERALGVSGLKASDFYFALGTHSEKISTFVAILPIDLWVKNKAPPETVFLTPLLDMLPPGFAEISPGFFECVKSIDLVRVDLTAVGMIESTPLKRLLRGKTSDHHVVKAQTNVDYDWANLSTEWDTMTPKQRQVSLPDHALTFAALDDGYGNAFVFLVPTEHFKETGEPMERDLGLEDRLPSNIEVLGHNAFRLLGANAINATALMCRNKFRDDLNFTLAVNLALVSTDLGAKIGFDAFK